MTLYVNEEPVDAVEIEREIEQLRPYYEEVFADLPVEDREKQLQEWSRENVIERLLLRQAAMRAPIDVEPEEIEKAFQEIAQRCGGEEKLRKRLAEENTDEGKIRAEIERNIRLDRFLEKLTENAPEPSEEDVRKFYDENTERYTSPEMVRASHIVKHLTPEMNPETALEEMRNVRRKLRNNAYFADMAAECSDCPDQGGDLGFFPRGQMVQEFEDVVFNLGVGEISDVFQTGFGYHIAKVTDRRSASLEPLDKIRETVEKDARNQLRQKLVEDFVDAEKAKAAIEEK